MTGIPIEGEEETHRKNVMQRQEHKVEWYMYKPRISGHHQKVGDEQWNKLSFGALRKNQPLPPQILDSRTMTVSVTLNLPICYVLSQKFQEPNMLFILLSFYASHYFLSINLQLRLNSYKNSFEVKPHLNVVVAYKNESFSMLMLPN